MMMTYEEFRDQIDEIFPREEGFYLIIDCDDRYYEDTPVEIYYRPRQDITEETRCIYSWCPKASKDELRAALLESKERMMTNYQKRLEGVYKQLQEALGK